MRHSSKIDTDMEAFRRRLRERAPPKLGSSYTGPAVTAGFAAQGENRALCARLTGCQGRLAELRFKMGGDC